MQLASSETSYKLSVFARRCKQLLVAVGNSNKLLLIYPLGGWDLWTPCL